MPWSITFFVSSILLGVGLAMDAFSVSVANGLHERGMKRSKIVLIAGVFAFFQALMPMIGWICVRTVASEFRAFEKLVPWIALALLLFIGGKMIRDGIRSSETEEKVLTGVAGLMVQGIATSLDALSVGFTIDEYGALQAFVCALIIAVVTFGICIAGSVLGKTIGNRIGGRAEIFGGVILIAIGIEIFVTRVIL